MATVFLVRHGKAGSRSKWDGADELRPLTKPGLRQAGAITKQLAGTEITRIVTSPYVRCRQTVEPLGAQLGVAVDLSDALAEGAPLRESLRLFEKVADEPSVLCTHGDVMGELLEHFARHGVVLDDNSMEKGSIWVLEVEDGAVVAASYQLPPA